MDAGLESFSPEILYEIFDYLSAYDIFHAWIDLNDRLNDIIGSYTLKVDFRNISRSKFENMAKQVIVFQRYSPHFKYQFHHLRTLKFLRTENILSNLPPPSVSALSNH